MKIIASLCIFVVCAGCSDDEKDLNVSVNSIDFSYSGGEKSFNISSNTFWTVSSSVPTWLTVSPTTGSDNGTIEVTASNNTTQSSRTATITISGENATTQIVKVNQDASPPKALVRFRKEGAMASVITSMRFSDIVTNAIVIQHNFQGTGNETSMYYEITPGNYSPSFYITLDVNAWLTQTNLRSYNFLVGRSYTITFDLSLSVTVDQ